MDRFSLEQLIVIAVRSGLSRSEHESALTHLYHRGEARYNHTHHPIGNEPIDHKRHAQAARAWGFVEGKQYINAYVQKQQQLEDEA